MMRTSESGHWRRQSKLPMFLACRTPKSRLSPCRFLSCCGRPTRYRRAPSPIASRVRRHPPLCKPAMGRRSSCKAWSAALDLLEFIRTNVQNSRGGFRAAAAAISRQSPRPLRRRSRCSGRRWVLMSRRPSIASATASRSVITPSRSMPVWGTTPSAATPTCVLARTEDGLMVYLRGGAQNR